MTIETAAQALVFLNKKKDRKFEMINRNLYIEKDWRGEDKTYTARELIKLAKVWSSENNQETSIKKNIKHFSNRKNRTHTRDALSTHDFDKIPSVNNVVAEDDRWNWD
jgi:uncharacterized protein with WD repeat